MAIMHIRKNTASRRGSIRAHSRWPNPVGCATGNTSAQSHTSLVSSVVGSHPIPIISVSHKAAHYRAGRATNLPFRSAAVTIAKCIAATMEPYGGNA